MKAQLKNGFTSKVQKCTYNYFETRLQCFTKKCFVLSKKVTISLKDFTNKLKVIIWKDF